MKTKSLTRPSELVLSAIYNLDEDNGSSLQDIVNYIAENFNIDREDIQKRVEEALKRSLSFGLLQKDSGGLYKLRNINEIPETIMPQRARRKRKKITRQRKEDNRDLNEKKSSKSRKKMEKFSNPVKSKRARMEQGGYSRNKSITIDSNLCYTCLGGK